MESRYACRRYLARLRPILRRRPVRRRIRARLASAGAKLGGTARDECRSRYDAPAVSVDGARRLPAGARKLALPAGAVPRLLRLLQSRPVDFRNAIGERGARPAQERAAHRVPGGDGTGGSDADSRSDTARRAMGEVAHN